MAHGSDGFQGHVARPLDRPFVVLLVQDGADQAGDGGLVGKDADDIGPAFDLAIEALQRIGRVELGAVLLGEAHVGQHVGLGLVHQVRQLGHLGAELVGHLAPLGLGGHGILLGEGGGDEGRHHAPALLAGMGEEVAHEVDPAPLPGGVEDPGGAGLEAFVVIGDHQFHAAQAAPGQGAQELGPKGLGLRDADRHAQDFAPAPIVDAHGDDHGDRDDAPGLAHLHIGGVQPEIGPVAFQGALKEGLDLVVDLLSTAEQKGTTSAV